MGGRTKSKRFVRAALCDTRRENRQENKACAPMLAAFGLNTVPSDENHHTSEFCNARTTQVSADRCAIRNVNKNDFKDCQRGHNHLNYRQENSDNMTQLTGIKVLFTHTLLYSSRCRIACECMARRTE